MRLTAFDASFGAFVDDVDLGSLTDAAFREIEEAWHHYGVLVFRDQHLSDESHLAFSRRFGRLEAGLKRTQGSGLARLTNITPEGTAAKPSSLQYRFHVGNTYWHSDSSYKHVGAKASLLAAHVVPEQGGETEWADMRAAWDALDDDMKSYLEGRGAVHSYEYSHAWHGGLELLSPQDLQNLPPVNHPIVRVHPATGRKSLFVGRHASHIIGDDGDREGADKEESRALLKRITEEACQPPRTFKHHWSPGDLGVWDNRCMLHRGHLWPEEQKRLMVRTTVAGDGDNDWVLSEAV